MPPKSIVFSHANCMDGLAAAWAMHTALGSEAEYVFCHYDDPVWRTTDVRDKEVYFVDFSAPRQDLIDMCAKAITVTVADHHKTAQAALDNTDEWAPINLRLIFDMTKSGARLAMELANRISGDDEIPYIITYVEDRDLWNWKLPHSAEISGFLDTLDRTIIEFGLAARQLETEAGFDKAVMIGRTIREDQQRRAKAKVAGMYRMEDDEGRIVYMCNATELGSEIGNTALRTYPEAAYTVTYFDKYEADTITRVFSLRARKEGTDVSAIAKANGGGGHAAAAGFSVVSQSALSWRTK